MRGLKVRSESWRILGEEIELVSTVGRSAQKRKTRRKLEIIIAKGALSKNGSEKSIGHSTLQTKRATRSLTFGAELALYYRNTL